MRALALAAVLSVPNFQEAWSQDQRVPAGFVRVDVAIPTIVLDLRYFGTHNFIGRRVDGYHAPVAYLTAEAAEALSKVQEDLVPLGLGLKIYDAYRPQQAVNMFVAWAGDPEDTRTKAEFYPDVAKGVLFDEGYIAARSSHTRGSTVDLTIVPNPAPEQPLWSPDRQEACTASPNMRYADNSLDMGTGYDCFDPQSWTEDSRVEASARAHRLLLKTVMEKHGFRNYPKEWWHFTLVDEPFPDTYFDFPVQ